MTSFFVRSLFASISLALLGLAACGGSDEESTGVSSTPTTMATGTVRPTETPTPAASPAPTSIPTPVPTPTPALGTELVVNGSFEEGAAEPDGWTIFVPDGQSVEWVTSDAHTDQRSIKFTFNNTEPPGPQISSTALIVLEKGKTYELSAYVRTDQQAAFSLGMNWFNDDGVTREGSQTKPHNDFVSTEWTQVFIIVDSSTFPFYPDASIGTVVLNGHQQSDVAPSDAKEFTLYIDDLSLREILD